MCDRGAHLHIMFNSKMAALMLERILGAKVSDKGDLPGELNGSDLKGRGLCRQVQNCLSQTIWNKNEATLPFSIARSKDMEWGRMITVDYLRK